VDDNFAGYLRAYENAWRVFEDVADALVAIGAAGLATAVLTNGTKDQQNDKLARVGLAGRVNVTCGPARRCPSAGCRCPASAARRSRPRC
jgi:FMN phosphatase YigB (HAD superfamily)